MTGYPWNYIRHKWDPQDDTKTDHHRFRSGKYRDWSHKEPTFVHGLELAIDFGRNGQ